jgi:hypothetical protein
MVRDRLAGWCSLLGTGAALGTALATALVTALVTALAAAPARAAAQVQPIANLVVGDGVMVVKAGPEKHVYVGAAGADTRTVTLTFDAGSVDDFVGDAQALVARGTRPLPAHVSDRPEIQESASPRALSVTRHVARAHGALTVSYHLFVSDDKLGGFTIVTTPAEMRSILLALHKAARAAYAASAPPDTTHHPKPRRRPTHPAPAPTPSPVPAPPATTPSTTTQPAPH